MKCSHNHPYKFRLEKLNLFPKINICIYDDKKICRRERYILLVIKTFGPLTLLRVFNILWRLKVEEFFKNGDIWGQRSTKRKGLVFLVENMKNLQILKFHKKCKSLYAAKRIYFHVSTLFGSLRDSNIDFWSRVFHAAI